MVQDIKDASVCNGGPGFVMMMMKMMMMMMKTTMISMLNVVRTNDSQSTTTGLATSETVSDNTVGKNPTRRQPKCCNSH